MSLLSSSRALARHASLLPPELVVACLHTSASAANVQRSRTRLAKDLRPRSAKGQGTLVVAPSPRRERDGAPHAAPGTRDRFKSRDEDMHSAREWKQRRDARRARREESEDRRPPRREQSEDRRRPRREQSEDRYRPRREESEDRRRPRREQSEDRYRPRRGQSEDRHRPRREESEDRHRPRREESDDRSRPRREESDGRPRREESEDRRQPRREGWGDRRQPREERARPSLRGWEQSTKNVRQPRPDGEDVPDYDQPWRTRKEELWKPAAQVDNYGIRDAEENPAKVVAPPPPPPRRQYQNPLSDEFDLSSRAASTQELATEFTSPPLMEGLRTSVVDVLGPQARPTPIQALSLKHLCTKSGDNGEYVQCLLASETGSGKSMAYLLPMLQALKLSELQSDAASTPPSQLPLAPRALVLSPTHELSRQLSGFAKALLHEIKLRVLCASQANLPSTPSRSVTASKMLKELDFDDLLTQEGAPRKTTRPVDVVVGTTAKILELVKGRGWDREQPSIEDTWDKEAPKPRRFTIGKPEMGLERVEWIVVDEADVLFDPDFQEHTNMILSAIAEARGQPVELLDEATRSKVGPENPAPVNYPFNLLLSTATIPSALAWYLDTYHPALLRLASPRLHHLPKTLKTEYVSWTSGNRNADVERQLRLIWHEETHRQAGRRSKVLIFCNRSTKVEDLSRYLDAKGVANVALTSSGEARKWGSNHHLDGFLKVKDRNADEVADPGEPAATPAAPADVGKDPHVMITTSLLSRGLDFSPDVKHVFIVDEPRNMIDFLHRAGRSGRAGEQGKVVVFGKMKGRGSDHTKEVRRKVRALAA